MFTLIIGIYNYDRSMAELQTKASNTANLAAISLVEPVWNFDDAALQGIVKAILLDSDVLGIRVAKAGSDKAEVETLRNGVAEKSFNELLKNPANVQNAAKIKREGVDIASVQIVTSTNKVLDLVRYTSVLIAVFAAVLVLLLSGFIWLLGKRIIQRPIEALRVSADQLASGNLNYAIDTSRRDELGSLAHSFDSMRNAIRKMLAVIEEQNRTLEEKILQRTAELRQKTNDIQTMLQNMPQGILTVVQGAVIHPEYSAYLEQIFETRDIAGQKLMNLVFTNTNLGSDVLSQVEAAADACIGEDKMNFGFNSHVFVTEFDKIMPNGKAKSLELSWSPICNEDDVCEKLMLCVRDVTELKALAAEAGQQKRELEMIGQILAVNQEKFHQFIDSSSEFIKENQEIIQKTKAKDMEAIGLLFRNMHTIKGNARTFGLLQLTNTVHETEQTYDNLRKNTEVAWNQALLLEQLQQAANALQEYAKVNEVKLGRKGPGRRGGVEKYLMVQKERIEFLIDGLEKLNPQNSSEKDELIRKVLGTLKQIGTEKMEDILAAVIDSLPSLAKELGKEAPTVTIESGHIVIRNQISDLLKNVFTHLLRNSIDHGIETAENRLTKGKQAAGTIVLALSVADGKLWLKLSDDGKGLGVEMIRQKAIESGLIRPEQTMTAEQLAQLIFASGFSTAASVTEVSGRGVGMDAVKGFVEREGGTIELRFTSDDTGSEFRRFEVVIGLPERFAVIVSA
ncbi:MAG: HAMP domain-containing protein [Rhodoferax sp.]|nr:HAMP domain-containing protein [Rhodoferax sp.]